VTHSGANSSLLQQCELLSNVAQTYTLPNCRNTYNQNIQQKPLTD